jgi:hypothetical protein
VWLPAAAPCRLLVADAGSAELAWWSALAHSGHLPGCASHVQPHTSSTLNLQGYNAKPANVELVLAAFRTGLELQGYMPARAAAAATA